MKDKINFKYNLEKQISKLKDCNISLNKINEILSNKYYKDFKNIITKLIGTENKNIEIAKRILKNLEADNTVEYLILPNLYYSILLFNKTLITVINECLELKDNKTLLNILNINKDFVDIFSIHILKKHLEKFNNDSVKAGIETSNYLKSFLNILND